jgi:hypothetical protein
VIDFTANPAGFGATTKPRNSAAAGCESCGLDRTKQRTDCSQFWLLATAVTAGTPLKLVLTPVADADAFWLSVRVEVPPPETTYEPAGGVRKFNGGRSRVCASHWLDSARCPADNPAQNR